MRNKQHKTLLVLCMMLCLGPLLMGVVVAQETYGAYPGAPTQVPTPMPTPTPAPVTGQTTSV